jgi:ribosomal protein S18 acetylase RimI-like enzyme
LYRSFSGKIHYSRTGDIYVCRVDPKYHGKGIGTLLYKKVEKYFIKNNCKYIIVKTLSEMDFYKKVGFKESITLTEMRDENNPCLIMIKKI